MEKSSARHRNRKKIMKKNLLPFLLVMVISGNIIAQEFETEDEHLKGWTKDTKIVYADFKGKPSERLKRLNKEAGLQASAQVRLKSILDVPKKKRNRGPLLEKVYLAPFFDKTASMTMTTDENELNKQILYFDIGELFARLMRKNIQDIQDSTKAYGTMWVLYSSMKNFYCEKFKEMSDAYTYEVFVEKIEGAFDKWKDIVDEELRKLEEYATKKEDCHRLLTETPVDARYEQSKNIVGSLKGCWE